MNQLRFEPGDGIEYSWHAIRQRERDSEAAEDEQVGRLASATLRIVESFDECDLADAITPEVLGAVKAGNARDAGLLLVQAYQAYVQRLAERAAA